MRKFKVLTGAILLQIQRSTTLHLMVFFKISTDVWKKLIFLIFDQKIEVFPIFQIKNLDLIQIRYKYIKAEKNPKKWYKCILSTMVFEFYTIF